MFPPSCSDSPRSPLLLLVQQTLSTEAPSIHLRELEILQARREETLGSSQSYEADCPALWAVYLQTGKRIIRHREATGKSDSSLRNGLSSFERQPPFCFSFQSPPPSYMSFYIHSQVAMVYLHSFTENRKIAIYMQLEYPKNKSFDSLKCER